MDVVDKASVLTIDSVDLRNKFTLIVLANDSMGRYDVAKLIAYNRSQEIKKMEKLKSHCRPTYPYYYSGTANWVYGQFSLSPERMSHICFTALL